MKSVWVIATHTGEPIVTPHGNGRSLWVFSTEEQAQRAIDIRVPEGDTASVHPQQQTADEIRQRVPRICWVPLDGKPDAKWYTPVAVGYMLNPQWQSNEFKLDLEKLLSNMAADAEDVHAGTAL